MLLQAVIGPTVIEAGVLPRREGVVMGQARLREEEHPGEVVIHSPGQPLLIHRRPHTLAADDFEIVLVAVLQLFQQEVDLFFQDDVLLQEHVGPRLLPAEEDPSVLRGAVLLQPGPAGPRLLQSRLQLRHAAAEQRLLPVQQGQRLPHRPALQIGADGPGWDFQLPQGADDVEGTHVLNAVHAVAVLPPHRVEQPLLLIVAQGVGAEIKELGQLVDLIKLLQLFSLRLLTFG